MAVLDEYDREPVELQAHLAHVIGSRVGDVKGAFRLVLDRHAEDAWVLLQPLIKDRLVLLGGNVTLSSITEAPHSTELITWDDRGLVLGLLMRDVDVVSRGSYACSVGDNTPRDGDLTWLSLLGGVHRLYSRCIPGLHLPGLGGHRWCHGLLPGLINLLSLIGDAEGVTLGRSLLVCFSVGLREWVVPLDL